MSAVDIQSRNNNIRKILSENRASSDFPVKEEEIELHENLVQYMKTLHESPSYKTRTEIETTILRGDKSSSARKWLQRELELNGLPILRALKIFILLSITQGGMKSEDLNNLIKEFSHCYGHDVLQAFNNMQLVGILGCDGKQQNIWKYYCKQYDLLHGTIPLAELCKPVDCDYIFPDAGYSPLTVRLVQNLIENGAELVDPLLGISSSMNKWMVLDQTKESDLKSTTTTTTGVGKVKELPLNNPVKLSPGETVMVCVVGGITYAEIAALRYLSSQTRVNFISTSTAIINGDALLKTICSTPSWH